MATASSKRLVRCLTVAGRCISSVVRVGIPGRMTLDQVGASALRQGPGLPVVRCAKGNDLRGGTAMQVRDGMSSVVVTVGPGHTLRAAARLMAGRSVGAAVVVDPDGAGPGILTERDVLTSVGEGQDADTELVSAHLTADVVFAAPSWS